MNTHRHLPHLVMAASLVVSAGCASLPPAGGPGNALIPSTSGSEISWPEGYLPEQATFFVHNQVDIAAPPEVVWDIVVEASTWPDWYEGASNVQLGAGGTTRLEADSVFDWETMGFSFRSSVVEFDPPTRLSWESRKSTLKGYHAWLLVPVEGGTRLITDESQIGLLAVLQGWFLPDKLQRLHDAWLVAIKERAEARVSAAGPLESTRGAVSAAREPATGPGHHPSRACNHALSLEPAAAPALGSLVASVDT